MNKLTTDRLETIATWREKYGNGANVMIPAEEAELMARQLLAYEQAAKNPVAWTDSDELEDANKGYSAYLFALDGEANKYADPRRKIMLYAAPVLPKQPELVVLTDEQIDAVLDSKANMAYIISDKRERLRMFAREIIRTAMISTAPAQPVIPEQRQMVPDERPADSSNGNDAEAWFDEGWNACRAEMLKAQPVSEPYKFPQGWIKGQFAYQDLFNAIGAAVVSKHPSIEISVKAFEDSMLAAAPAQDGKSAPTELPNHFNLSTNSPVIPDGWKLVPIEPTAAMFHAFNDCDYGRKSMRERYIQMIEAAPAQESE